MSKDGVLQHQEHSPTAATVGNPLFGPSGPMIYRVTISNGTVMTPVDVEADGGDDAAEKVLKMHIGARVAHVEPAPQKRAA